MVGGWEGRNHSCSWPWRVCAPWLTVVTFAESCLLASSRKYVYGVSGNALLLLLFLGVVCSSVSCLGVRMREG